MAYIKIGDRYQLAVRRPMHVAPDRGNLYLRLRRQLGVRQVTMASYLGISVESVRHRERRKQMYRIGELLALKELGDLSADEFVRLLEDCA